MRNAEKCKNRTNLQHPLGDTIPFRESAPLVLFLENVAYEDRIAEAKRDFVRPSTAYRKKKQFF